MNDLIENSARRTDVGYKRPPREHQFKKGQKPPRRKAKVKPQDPSPDELLWKLLQEQRRAKVGKNVRWLTNAELLIRMAFQMADAGNATMRRLTTDLLMLGATPGESGDSEPVIIFE